MPGRSPVPARRPGAENAGDDLGRRAGTKRSGNSARHAASSAAGNIRLFFRNAGDAEASIAGVARAARAVARFPGAQSIWVDIASGETLATSALDDILRANPRSVLAPAPSTRATYRRTLIPADPTIAQILNATGKSSDGIVSRWINRPLSRLISRPLLMVPGIRPAHATLMTAAFGVAMLCCLLTRSYWGLIGGGLLFQAASVIDGVDGEIARATFRSSARGAMLDTAVDMVINVSFVVGLTISLTALYGPVHAALGASAVVLIVSGLLILAWLARRVGDPGNFNVIKIFYRRHFPTGPAARITDALVVVTSRDFFALLFALLIVIGLGQSIPLLLNGFALIWLSLTLFSIRPILQACAPAARPTGPRGDLRRQTA